MVSRLHIDFGLKGFAAQTLGEVIVQGAPLTWMPSHKEHEPRSLLEVVGAERAVPGGGVRRFALIHLDEQHFPSVTALGARGFE